MKKETELKDLSTEIDIEVTEPTESADEGDAMMVDDSVRYCPHWMFPARYGRVKVSSVLRAVLITLMAIAIVIFFILSVMPNSPGKQDHKVTANKE